MLNQCCPIQSAGCQQAEVFKDVWWQLFLLQKYGVIPGSELMFVNVFTDQKLTALL